jgi:peptidoglycan biosynthesis protein MviN/MurJ (putative lipid II flippase)
VPFALFVAMAAVPLTALIFKGGYFDAEAVRRTAVSLAFYTFMLPAAAIEMLVMQAFFANRRMVSVTVIGILFSTFSMFVSWTGLKLCGGRDLLLLASIAGGMTLARTLKCVTLVELLKKNAPVFPFRETVVFLGRVTLASGLAAVCGWFLLNRMGASPGSLGEWGNLIKLGGLRWFSAVSTWPAPTACTLQKCVNCPRSSFRKCANGLERPAAFVLNSTRFWAPSIGACG